MKSLKNLNENDMSVQNMNDVKGGKRIHVPTNHSVSKNYIITSTPIKVKPIAFGNKSNYDILVKWC